MRGGAREGELVFRSISPTSFHPRRERGAAAAHVFVSINCSPRSPHPHSHSRDGGNITLKYISSKNIKETVERGAE